MQHLSDVGGWCKTSRPQSFDINSIFFSNQNAPYPWFWRMTSSHCWVLRSTQLSFLTKIVSIVEAWHKANIWFWHQPDFHFQEIIWLNLNFDLMTNAIVQCTASKALVYNIYIMQTTFMVFLILFGDKTDTRSLQIVI